MASRSFSAVGSIRVIESISRRREQILNRSTGFPSKFRTETIYLTNNMLTLRPAHPSLPPPQPKPCIPSHHAQTQGNVQNKYIYAHLATLEWICLSYSLMPPRSIVVLGNIDDLCRLLVVDANRSSSSPTWWWLCDFHLLLCTGMF